MASLCLIFQVAIRLEHLWVKRWKWLKKRFNAISRGFSLMVIQFHLVLKLKTIKTIQNLGMAYGQ